MAALNYSNFPAEIKKLCSSIEKKTNNSIDFIESQQKISDNFIHAFSNSDFKKGKAVITIKGAPSSDEKQILIIHEILHLYLEMRGYQSFYPRSTKLAQYLNSLLIHSVIKTMGQEYDKYCNEKPSFAASIINEIKSKKSFGSPSKDFIFHILFSEWAAALARGLIFYPNTHECNELQAILKNSKDLNYCFDIASSLVSLIKNSYLSLSSAVSYKSIMDKTIEIINGKFHPIIGIDFPRFPAED